MARVLMIHPEKCTGCRNCELACAFSHDGGELRLRTTRVHVFSWEREGFSVPMMCQQCDRRRMHLGLPDRRHAPRHARRPRGLGSQQVHPLPDVHPGLPLWQRRVRCLRAT